LIEYYMRVAVVLPYLKIAACAHAVSGWIKGKSFFQKDARWIPPGSDARIHSDDVGRDIDYFVVDDRESLRYVANLGTIPCTSGARGCRRSITGLARARPRSERRAVHRRGQGRARAHRILDELALPSYVRLRATGLHILLPLGARYDYEVTRTFARLLAAMASRRAGDLDDCAAAALARRQGLHRLRAERRGRHRGAVLGAPAARRRSCPLRWEESPQARPARFTIKTAPARSRSSATRWPGAHGTSTSRHSRKLERRTAPDR